MLNIIYYSRICWCDGNEWNVDAPCRPDPETEFIRNSMRSYCLPA